MLGVAHLANVVLEPEGEMGMVASSNSSSNSISASRAALVVAVVPEGGVAIPREAVPPLDRSSATGVVELGMSLPTAQRL